MERLLMLTIGLTIFVMVFTQMSSAALTNRYVDKNCATPGEPYDSWANAATDIQTAINYAYTVASETVLVANATYDTGGVTNYPADTLLTNRVAIWKAITVRSANNDPTNTIIKGRFDTGEPGAANTVTNGPAAVRCVWMTNGASLIGFTITNGATFTDGNYATNQAGGGVWCNRDSATTIISNCVIAGNSAGSHGAGVYGGAVYNSRIAGNRAFGDGGGLCRSYSVSYSTIIGNIAVNGGGMIECGNTYNCTIVSNVASAGGGTYYGEIYNCLFAYNTADHYGGACQADLYNCTIVNNTGVLSMGGGMDNCRAINCISWNNNRDDTRMKFYSYSCGGGYTNGDSVWPTGTGPGNIATNPLFVDSAGGNYRLTADSHCLNTGSNDTWTTTTVDLDGHHRIDGLSGLVDMGAYEFTYKITVFQFH